VLVHLLVNVISIYITHGEDSVKKLHTVVSDIVSPLTEFVLTGSCNGKTRNI
jgi:hypothetical protein